MNPPKPPGLYMLPRAVHNIGLDKTISLTYLL